MQTMPWVKYQDYYLRLGFLKVLVGVLSPSRRSVLNEGILRRLKSPLLEPAEQFPALWRDVGEGTLLKKRVNRKTKSTPRSGLRPPGEPFATVAQALLVAGNCPSTLYGITPTQAQKTLDWARDVQFIGRGNQITERGLILQALLPTTDVSAFLSGDPGAWNPFLVERRERVFFFYHLGEIDRVSWEIPRLLPPELIGSVVESNDAATIVCRCLFTMLQEVSASLSPRATIEFRDAKELACGIARELKIHDYDHLCSDVKRRPERLRIGPKTSATGGGAARTSGKKADHETIPRFEQLVDLGFMTKWLPPSDTGEPTDARAHWKYVPTDLCRRWAARTAAVADWTRFRWSAFCGTIIDTFGLPRRTETPTWHEVADRLWRSYQTFHRSVGHTPFESVALLAMIDAAADGVELEIVDFHTLLLTAKTRGALQDHAFFASGTSVDRMFILLKDGFTEETHRCLGTLGLRNLTDRN